MNPTDIVARCLDEYPGFEDSTPEQLEAAVRAICARSDLPPMAAELLQWAIDNVRWNELPAAYAAG